MKHISRLSERWGSLDAYKKLLNDLKCLFTFEENPTTLQTPLITPVHLQPKVTIEPEGKEPPEVKNRLNEIKWDDWNNSSGVNLAFKDLKVSGVTFNNPDGVSRQKILSHMEKWEVVDIVREPDNPQDPNALLVMSGMGAIGHIDRHYASMMSPLIAKGAKVLAKLSGLYGGKGGKNYGARVEVHLQLPDSIQHHYAKVVGVRGKNDEGEDRQEVIDDLEIGESVILYDSYDTNYKDCVRVECANGDFGKLSVRDTKIILPLLEAKYKYLAVLVDKSDRIIISACFWKN